MYDGSVDPLLGVCTPEEWRAVGGAGLVVPRSLVMDPFLDAPETPDHIGGLIAALRHGAEECFEDLDLRHRARIELGRGFRREAETSGRKLGAALSRTNDRTPQASRGTAGHQKLA